jgi:hypothetical protein
VAGAVILRVRLPRGQDFEEKMLAPKTERRVAGAHARRGAVAVMQCNHRQRRGSRGGGGTQRRNGIGGQAGQPARLHRVVAANHEVSIEHANQIPIGHRSGLRRHRVAEILQSGDHRLAVFKFAAPCRREQQSGFAVRLADRADQHREIVRRRRDQFGVAAEHAFGFGPRKEDHAGQQRAHRMQANAHRGYDSKIAAAAAQGPEQFGVVRGIGAHELAVGEDDLGPQQVVQSEAILSVQQTIAAAERQARHADGAAIAGHGDEPMRGRGVDHVCGRGTASNNGRFCGYLDIDLPHG